MATSSSSEEGLASSVSNLAYGDVRSTFSMMIGGDFPSISFSDIDDLLPDLADDGIPNLLFLRTKTQAARAASAAPTKMQPIAMPMICPRESPELSLDEGEVVCAILEDVRGATIVGEARLSLPDVRDTDMLFGDVELDGTTDSLEETDVVVPPLLVAGSVKEGADDALGAGDALKYIVTPSVFLKITDIGAGVGMVENVWSTSSLKVKGVIYEVARTHGSLNVHIGVYIKVVSAVAGENEDMSSA